MKNDNFGQNEDKSLDDYVDVGYLETEESDGKYFGRDLGRRELLAGAGALLAMGAVGSIGMTSGRLDEAAGEPEPVYEPGVPINCDKFYVRENGDIIVSDVTSEQASGEVMVFEGNDELAEFYREINGSRSASKYAYNEFSTTGFPPKRTSALVVEDVFEISEDELRTLYDVESLEGQEYELGNGLIEFCEL